MHAKVETEMGIVQGYLFIFISIQIYPWLTKMLTHMKSLCFVIIFQKNTRWFVVGDSIGITYYIEITFIFKDIKWN